MERHLIWPDPVPCCPENPVHGIRTCVARRKNIKCPWLKVNYCAVNADDMSDALEGMGLTDLNWILEDDLDPDEVAEAAIGLRDALSNRLAERSDAAIAVRWFASFLEAVRGHGGGLTDRFAERIDSRDRY